MTLNLSPYPQHAKPHADTRENAMSDIPSDIVEAASAAYPEILSLQPEFAKHFLATIIFAERRRCIDAQPSTAENPNEDTYQRGRFDGVMEYGRAIVNAKGHLGDDLPQMQIAYRRAIVLKSYLERRKHPLDDAMKRTAAIMRGEG